MCVVILKDGSVCYVDTENELTARRIVAKKSDNPGIAMSVHVDENIKNTSKYYNSPDINDNIPLRCFSEWR